MGRDDAPAKPVMIRYSALHTARVVALLLLMPSSLAAPLYTQEAAPLLDNPLRNGLLLAALAVRLTGMPLPAGVLTDPPRDVRSARTNVLCAVDHLGLLAAPWVRAGGEGCRLSAHAARRCINDAIWGLAVETVPSLAGATGERGTAHQGRGGSFGPGCCGCSHRQWHWSVPLTKPVTKRREHG